MDRPEGFALVERVLEPERVAALRAALDGSSGAVSRRGASVYARRNVLHLPAVAAVAQSSAVQALIGAATQPVRAILFDKVPGANWHVGWHQDRAIAVGPRQELPGWGPWSVKAGVSHVLPPADVLAKLVTVRLHLDPCAVDGGPLRVLPGSHRQGILSNAQIQALRAATPEVVCTAALGTALVMEPLLLHASSPVTRTGDFHRRVLHLEFAPPGLLPAGLAWEEA